MINQEMIYSGLVGAIITVLFGLALKGLKACRLWYLKEDIDNLQFERNHLEEIKRSSVAMNRSAFRGVFFLLGLLGVAQVCELVLPLLDIHATFIKLIVASYWLLIAMIGFSRSERYGKLSNYEESIQALDQKLSKLQIKQQRLL